MCRGVDWAWGRQTLILCGWKWPYLCLLQQKNNTCLPEAVITVSLSPQKFCLNISQSLDMAVTYYQLSYL
jgi:hypothetical protein